MTDSSSSSAAERIAKVMARAGVASRRDAEKLIVAGRVAVNGKVISSPALDVLPTDRVTLDGKPIDAPQPAKLWLYYKPLGLVTSARDEKGRQTVFDTLPEGMPRVMSVGRLDLNSEGLLLLTNDGALKRRLELPSTGWLRKYRVRVNGRPNDATFDPLRRGVEIEGDTFLPMEVTLDKQQGANAWLTVGLREGKNREIRRAMTEVGLIVNRLIRVSYGPFRLNTMKPGDVVEVKAKVLRDQLGEGHDADGARDGARNDRARKDDTPRKPAMKGGKPFGRPRAEDGDRPRAPREQAEDGTRRDFKPRPPRDGDAPRKPRFEGGKPFGRPRAEDGDRPRAPREQAEDGARRDFKPRPPRDGDAPRKPRFEGGKPFGRPRAEDGDRPRAPREQAEDGTRRDFKPRPPRDGDAPRGAAKGPHKGAGGLGGKPAGGTGFGGKPRTAKSGDGKAGGGKAGGGKGAAGAARPGGTESKPYADRPKGPRKGPAGPRRNG